MALKNYYQLLDIPPTSTPDEVKRAFRQQIARYHPDKVQHLGKEFQAMAADRAAELTEAYRILSDEGRREEFDRALVSEGGAHAPAPTAASAAPQTQTGRPSAPTEPSPPPPPPGPASSTSQQFQQERASRDEFVRKATVSRLRQALHSVGGYDEQTVRGFDIAWTPKSKLFSRTKLPRLLGKFVSRADADAVAEAWGLAGKAGVPDSDDICVLLVGAAVAPAGELALAIAEQRKKQRTKKLTLIPVDARDWDAHMPLDAPAIAKTLLARLKSGG